jgi:hypothetical protein
MDCCNNDKNNNNANINRSTPEGIDPCCNVNGRRCMCLPYDDFFMITAQLLSIVSVFVSWVWWVTFLVSLIGMSVIQIIWCCRQNQSMVLTSAAVAVASALTSIGIGIYILIVWSNESYCYTFVLNAYHYDQQIYYDDYVDDRQYDHCEEAKWGTIALVCGVIWSLVSVCIIHFVRSGRHARFEKHHAEAGTENSNANAVLELGTVAEASPATAEPTVAVAITLPEPTKMDQV